MSNSDLTLINDANTRRKVYSQRNSMKAAEQNEISEEQMAMENHWSNVIMAWCNVSPEDTEASDTSIVIPTTGVTEKWIHKQKYILEDKGYKVIVGGSSLKISI